MFASKYLSVILTCVFRDAQGNDVKWPSYKWQLICAQCACVLALGSITGNCFSSQVQPLTPLKTYGTSYQTSGNEEVSRKDELVKTFKVE